MTRGVSRTRGAKTPHERRNERLRPSPHLGYAEDRIGLHLMECEAFVPAEQFFRYAIWLNPYEPRFKVHLADSLCEQKRHPEALQILREVLAAVPDFPPAVRLVQRWGMQFEGQST